MQRRRFWGWGYEGVGPDAALLGMAEAGLSAMLGMNGVTRRDPPKIEQVSLRAPRIALPPSLSGLVDTSPFERASHTYGKSYRDLARAIAGHFEHPPDVVALPRDEADLVRILDACDAARLAVIPYGGGSSVCGGVEADIGPHHPGVVSLDLRHLDRVVEVDEVSRAARIQAGVMGPALEAQLKPRGLSLRHYPQSFEFSSLGGWIATRAGGHFATLMTHIDDMVESLRVVTPSGTIETRRLPGSGAGPSPERLFIGSEGALGIITEAWMRLQNRPRYRASATVRFGSFSAGAQGARAVAQSGLFPANCRLLDPLEAQLNGAGDGSHAVLIVGFESADHDVTTWIRRAVECCRDAGGEVSDDAIKIRVDGEKVASEASSAWRQAFLRAPYLRDELVLRGVFVETYETAVTWDRFDALVEGVFAAARSITSEAGARSITTCRLTHVYPDGAAPYFTVLTPARPGDELAQWKAIKDVVTAAVLEHGGTVTHHHAVGRDTRPYYDRERPDGFARALSAVKRELDPKGIMNPGVLLPEGSSDR